MKLLKYATLIGAVCAAFAMQSAKADTFTSSLDFGNDAIAGFLQPGEQFGTVTVDVTGTVATITFTANTAGGFEFIDTSAAAVNVANPGSAALVTDTEFKEFSSKNAVNGFGSFNLTVNNNDGSGSPVDTISFTVDVASGTSAADVLLLNASGFDAAAHISVNGGFAGEAPGGRVPDSGTTAMLLGTALAGLGFVRRYLKH